MIDAANFTLFIITSIAVILMPGPAKLFVISNGLSRGPKASLAAALGTTTGVSFHFNILKQILHRPTIQKVMKWCFAPVFMALGVRLALSQK